MGVVSRDKDWFCVNINEGFCLYLGLQEQLFIKQLYILYLTTGIHWYPLVHWEFFVFSLELVCECIQTNRVICGL